MGSICCVVFVVEQEKGKEESLFIFCIADGDKSVSHLVLSLMFIFLDSIYSRWGERGYMCLYVETNLLSMIDMAPCAWQDYKLHE